MSPCVCVCVCVCVCACVCVCVCVCECVCVCGGEGKRYMSHGEYLHVASYDKGFIIILCLMCNAEPRACEQVIVE